MVIDIIGTLDTFIYAALFFVVWNFYWTRKQKQKLLGDPKDPTQKGALVELEDLKQRVRVLEEDEGDECNCEEWRN